MMRKTIGALILALALLAGILTPALATPQPGAPKNVVIMIADGTGFNAFLAGDYYMNGEVRQQIFEREDWVRLACSTYSLGKDSADDDGVSYYNPAVMWEDFQTLNKYATDSSASATAIATGVKTYDYAIGVDQAKQPLSSLVSEFEAMGKATGAVSSVPISHATPASFVAHNPNRNDYAGISREEVWESPCEVLLGGGNPDYDDSGKKLDQAKYTYIEEETWLKLTSGQVTGADADGDGKADDWTFIQEKADFEAVAAGTNVPDRLLGIFTAGSTLQCYRAGYDMPMEEPFKTPFNENVPDLATMSTAALNVLDKDPDGFFLMIEGGATDWANHSGRGAAFIEEYADFVKAIETVCSWIESSSSWDETLLVITADHETGYITNAKGSFGVVGNNGKGAMPAMAYNSGGHTNQLVPFFAKGAGAQSFIAYADLNDPALARYFGRAFGITGDYLDNTEISQAIRTLHGIDIPDSGHPVRPTAAGHEVGIAPASATAVPSPQRVTVDGSAVSFDAYNIDGSNYFKLRDLAKVLDGTGRQFEISYNDERKAIDITTGKSYTAAGGEMTPGDGAAKTAVKSTATVYINGRQETLLAYNIGGNNYFKLRSLAKVLDFGVTYDKATNTVGIVTTTGYTG